MFPCEMLCFLITKISKTYFILICWLTFNCVSILSASPSSVSLMISGTFSSIKQNQWTLINTFRSDQNRSTTFYLNRFVTIKCSALLLLIIIKINFLKNLYSQQCSRSRYQSSRIQPTINSSVLTCVDI